MQNIVYFANKTARQKAQFASLMATADLSEMSGVNFSVTPDLISEGDYSEIDFVLGAVPATFTLSIGMSASGLDPAKPYPFATQSIVSGSTAMVVPVLADPAFIPWVVGLWTDIALHLAAKGAIQRVLSIGLGIIGDSPGDGQFHIPGAVGRTAVENASLWAGLGVTHLTVPQIMVRYMRALQAIPGFATVKYTLPVWCPYNDYLGSPGQGDDGRSYTPLEQAMQAAGGAAYVTPDQTLALPAERPLIRNIAAGRPYCCLIGNLPLTEIAKIVQTYELGAGYVAASPAGWVEVEQGTVGIISAALKAKAS
jgi:hypothetical protein